MQCLFIFNLSLILKSSIFILLPVDLECSQQILDFKLLRIVSKCLFLKVSWERSCPNSSFYTGEHSRGRTARAKAEGQEFSRGFLGPESCHCGYGTRSVFIEHVLFSKRGICVCSWLEIRIQGQLEDKILEALKTQLRILDHVL